jgi:hypothetical protein
LIDKVLGEQCREIALLIVGEQESVVVEVLTGSAGDGSVAGLKYLTER